LKKSWRRIIFDEIYEFFCFKIIYLPMILLSSLSIYKFHLLKRNFIDHIYPLLESISLQFDQEIYKDSINLSKITKKVKQIEDEIVCYRKIKTSIMKYDSSMSKMIARIFFSFILDIVACFCLLFLMITVYRFIILKKEISSMKGKIYYHEQLLDKKNENKIFVAEIHNQIFSQTFELLLDIPEFLVTILIMVFFPWRFYKHFCKKNEKNISMVRGQIFYIFLKGLTDVIGIVVLLFVLCGFWRWNYLFSSMKKIKKGEKVCIVDKDEEFYEGPKKKQIKLLIKTLFVEIFRDIFLLFPFAVLMVLSIYPFFIYYSFIKNNLKSKNHQFHVHRKTAQYCCLLVLLHIIIILIGVIIFITFVRIIFFFRLFKLSNLKREIENRKIKNYKRNYYEAHIDLIESEILILKFILYDIVTLFGFILVLVSFYRLNEWKEKRNLLEHECNFSENIDKEIIFEGKKNELILYLARQILSDLISLLILILLSVLILWRLPTFYFIYSIPSFEREIVDSMSMTNIPFEFRSKINKLQAEIFYCFIAVIHDIPYVPFFFINFLLIPWRFFTVTFGKDGIYQYDKNFTLQNQINKFRKNLISKIFKKGLLDYICLFEIVLITITFIRLPFLYLILKKNLWKQKGLSLHKCVHLTFKEMIKDLPFFFLSLIILIIAPWRVYALIHIFKSQKDRVPSFDNNEREIMIISQRKEIGNLFANVLIYDYICIMMIFILFISVYKAHIALEVIHIAWENSYYENPKYKNHDIQKKLISHIIILYEDSKSIFFVFVILILFVRVRSCYRRFHILL